MTMATAAFAICAEQFLDREVPVTVASCIIWMMSNIATLSQWYKQIMFKVVLQVPNKPITLTEMLLSILSIAVDTYFSNDQIL